MFRLSLAALIFILLLLLPLVGCANFKRTSPAFQADTLTGGKVSQNGDVQTPAKVNTSTNETNVEIPAGSKVEVTQATPTTPQKVTFTATEKTTLTSVTDTQNITGPVAIAPPSQTELAKGSAVKGSFVFAGLLVLVSLAMFYTSHYKAGCFAVLAAFVVPIGAQFLTSEKVVLVSSILATISLTLLGSWYLVTHKHELTPKLKR